MKVFPRRLGANKGRRLGTFLEAFESYKEAIRNMYEAFGGQSEPQGRHAGAFREPKLRQVGAFLERCEVHWRQLGACSEPKRRQVGAFLEH